MNIEARLSSVFGQRQQKKTASPNTQILSYRRPNGDFLRLQPLSKLIVSLTSRNLGPDLRRGDTCSL